MSADLAWPAEAADLENGLAGASLCLELQSPISFPPEEAEALHAALEEMWAGSPHPKCSVAERLSSAGPPSVEILANAAVAALRDGPTASSWLALHRLRLASPFLRKVMDGLLLQAVLGDESFATALATLASDLANTAAADPLRRARRWDREHFAALLQRWREAPDPYILWSGRSGWARLSWMGDDALHDILGMLSRTQPLQLASILSQFHDPHSTASALGWLGLAQRFQSWRKLLEAAPPAFADDGAWFGDCLVPLLLAAGHEALGGRGHRGGPIPTPEDVTKLAEAMATCVAARPDATGLGRWWAPLIAACVAGPSGQGADAKVRAAANWALLRALARSLPEQAWEPSKAARAASSEDWCLRAATAMAATEGRAVMPAVEGFLSPWKLSPDDLHGKPGTELARLARPFFPMEDWPHGSGTTLLGLPFIAAPSGAGAWARLWSDAGNLREIIEFGMPSEPQGGASSCAAELLMIAFAIGLAALDHSPHASQSAARAADAVAWLGVLFDAAREMRALDGFGYENWTRALRVLALRRAHYSTAAAAALPPEAEPTLPTLLASFGGDAPAVTAVTIDLARSGMSGPKILDVLHAAGIDPAWAVDTTVRLADADPRRGFLRRMASKAEALFNGHRPEGEAIPS